MTLSDKHLVLLSAAAQREDRLLTPAVTLKGHPRQALEAKLLKLKLVEVIPAGRDQPVWGEHETGLYGLRITSAGLAELGIEPEDEPADEPPATDTSTDQAPVAQPAALVRKGTKIAQVIVLLATDEGATVREIEATTGWLPHTVRAALTGLRKKGLRLERSTRGSGESVYRLAAEPAAASTTSSRVDEVR